MKLSIFFKDVKEPKQAQTLIEKKTQRLEKFFGSKTVIKWNCIRKGGSFQAEVSIVGPHFVYHAHATTFNFGEMVDKIILKLEKQVVRKSEKLKNRKEVTRRGDLKSIDPEQAWADHDEDSYDDAA